MKDRSIDMMNFHFRIMSMDDVEEVLVIEECSQSNPWTQKNFIDCIHAKYWNYVFLEEHHLSPILGFCIVMPGVEELHLLNISITPALRRKKIAWRALEAIEKTGLEHGYSKILLEVRRSNKHAIALYEKLGYLVIGARKDYYPMKESALTRREDALVMEKVLK